MNLADLSMDFDRKAVSWRAQSLTKAGDKAMALAYIDARDVMDRLDAVCGPAGWQDRYEFHGPRTVCYLSIKVGDEWITKADGAGDSDVEAEKGAISDALKRAAVKWGIGRYLYAIETPWVPCETYESNGKKHWKRWTADPWSCVRGGPVQSAPTRLSFESHAASIRGAATLSDLKAAFDAAKSDKSLSMDDADELIALKNQRKAQLTPTPKNLGEQLDRMMDEQRAGAN